MKPLYLPALAAPGAAPASEWIKTVDALRATGAEYPQIWHLFGFRPAMTVHLARFTQAVMREDGPLTPGFRELIAAYTSRRNECPF